MMDVSMFGNHHASAPAGYQAPEIGVSGNYSYFPHHIHSHPAESDYGQHHSPMSNSTPTSSSSNSSTANNFYHPHLYSPSAAEYGITATSASDEVYYDGGSGGGGGSGTPHTFYNHHQQGLQSANLIQDHIISSENGLSYTNLDYMYSQAHSGGGAGISGAANSVYLQSDEKVSLTHSYSLSDDVIVSSGQHTGTANTWHHHSGGGEVYSPLAHHLGLGSLHNLQGHNQNRQMDGSPSERISHASTGGHLQQVAQHSQQPTYKWMQVKRNVPKPQSKCICIHLIILNL